MTQELLHLLHQQKSLFKKIKKTKKTLCGVESPTSSTAEQLFNSVQAIEKRALPDNDWQFSTQSTSTLEND